MEQSNFISGGFDGTSNVLAGKLFNIPVKGTHAHAYVTSFTGAEDLANAEIKHKSEDYVEKNFFEKCLEWRAQLASHLKLMRDEAHDGELAAFASYAIAFPQGFLALVDTYDVSRYRLESALFFFLPDFLDLLLLRILFSMALFSFAIAWILD